MKEFYIVEAQKFATAANKFAHMANNAVNERQRELATRYFKDSMRLSKEYQKEAVKPPETHYDELPF